MTTSPESVSVPAAERAEALYAKLRPGPGRPAPEVASHQRARLHRATIELVSAHGYDGLTVRALTRRAGVSTRAFYEHFDSKEDCFLQTYERIVRRAVKRIVAAQAGESDWRKRLRLAFDAYVGELERDPQAARLVLIEAYGVGQEACEQVQRSEAMFEAMIAESFSRAPDGVSMPPVLIKAIAAGVARVSRARLLEPGTQNLTGLAETLTDWCLSHHSDVVDLLAIAESSLAPFSNLEEQEEPSLADDRALILTAVAKLIVANESDSLTVSKLCAATGLSRSAFKEHFASMGECLTAAQQLETRRAVTRALTQSGLVGSRPRHVHLAFACLSWQFANDLALAKTCFDDVSASGAMRVQSREHVVIWGVLRQAACAKSPTQPIRWAPAPLSFLALAPHLGAEGAMEAICGSGNVVPSLAPKPSSEEIENIEPKNLTTARDGVMLDGARDYLVART